MEKKKTNKPALNVKCFLYLLIVSAISVSEPYQLLWSFFVKWQWSRIIINQLSWQKCFSYRNAQKSDIVSVIFPAVLLFFPALFSQYSGWDWIFLLEFLGCHRNISYTRPGCSRCFLARCQHLYQAILSSNYYCGFDKPLGFALFYYS